LAAGVATEERPVAAANGDALESILKAAVNIHQPREQYDKWELIALNQADRGWREDVGNENRDLLSQQPPRNRHINELHRDVQAE
jgi:hypothetical protein